MPEEQYVDQLEDWQRYLIALPNIVGTAGLAGLIPRYGRNIPWLKDSVGKSVAGGAAAYAYPMIAEPLARNVNQVGGGIDQAIANTIRGPLNAVVPGNPFGTNEAAVATERARAYMQAEDEIEAVMRRAAGGSISRDQAFNEAAAVVSKWQARNGLTPNQASTLLALRDDTYNRWLVSGGDRAGYRQYKQQQQSNADFNKRHEQDVQAFMEGKPISAAAGLPADQAERVTRAWTEGVGYMKYYNADQENMRRILAGERASFHTGSPDNMARQTEEFRKTYQKRWGDWRTVPAFKNSPLNPWNPNSPVYSQPGVPKKPGTTTSPSGTGPGSSTGAQTLPAVPSYPVGQAALTPAQERYFAARRAALQRGWGDAQAAADAALSSARNATTMELRSLGRQQYANQNNVMDELAARGLAFTGMHSQKGLQTVAEETAQQKARANSALAQLQAQIQAQVANAKSTYMSGLEMLDSEKGLAMDAAAYYYPYGSR